MPKYKVNGKLYDIPEDKVEKFESKYPNATVEYHNEGTTYMIPLSKREKFESKYPNATLGVQAASVVAPEEEEKGNSAQDVVPRNVTPVQPMREEPEEVLPKEDKASEMSPEEVQKRIRQRAIFDATQQGVDESIKEGEARVGRILEPMTAEGREKRKVAEEQARMAGAETTLLGLTPSYPGQKGEEGSQEQDANNILGINTKYKKPVAISPVPYGVEYQDGKPVTQWLMPDGSITTNYAEADQAENEARKGRLRQAFERRMKDNGYIPGVIGHEENQTLIDAIVTGNNIGAKEHEAIVGAMRDNGLDPKNSEHAKWVVTEDQRSILSHRSEVAQERLKELNKRKQKEESSRPVSNKYVFGSGAIQDVSPQVAGTARTQLDIDIEAATAEVLLAEKAIKEYDNNREAAGKGWFGKTMQGLGDALTDINTYTFGVIDASVNSAVRNADITSEYGRRLIETAQLSQDLMLKAPNPGGWYSGSRFVGSMVFDPAFYLSGSFGGMAYKGAVKGLGKIVAREATEDVASRLVGQKLVGRMAAGAVSSATNLGTFELLGDMRQQWIDGGWTDSNGNFHEGFSLSHALGRGGHGAILGSVMGIWGAGVGNVADKMVKAIPNKPAIPNVVGKTAIRAGQVPVSIVGEGTIFAMPDIINYHSMSDDEFDKLYADKFGYAGESDEALRNAARDEARSQLSWDAWSESQAFIFGMKVAGKPLHAKKIIKTAGDRIKELKGADEREHRSFAERLTQMMDKSPLDVVMTREELDELRKGGYGELADLFVKSKKGTTAEAEPADRAIDFQRMEAEEVGTRREFDGYDAMQQLTKDVRISQSARAKAYFILTGCMLPMGTVTGYTKSKIAEGKVVVNSVTADGEVVTSRTFKSEKSAEQEVAKIKRQAELNSIDVGEKFANEALNLVMMEEVKGLVAQRYKLPEEAIEDIYTRQLFGERISEAEKQIVDDINSFIEQSHGSERYKSLTPEAMRDRIEEETGVKVDEALRKSEADRSEAENGAIKEYAKSLYEQAERVRRANNIYNEQSAEMRDEAWQMQRGDRLIEDGRAAEIKESVANRTHKDNGVIIPATMKVGDRPVYIIKGDVVMFADGSGIDVEKSSESVVIVDAQTGEKEFVSPDQIYKLSDSLNPHEVLSAEMDAYERMMRAERDSEIVDNSYNTDETDNAEGGDVLSTGEGVEGQRRDYAPGDKIVMEDSSGNIIYGEIVDYDAADDRYVVDVDSPIRGGYSPQMSREELDGMVVSHNGESVDKKMSMPTEKVEMEADNDSYKSDETYDSYDTIDNGLGVEIPQESGAIEDKTYNSDEADKRDNTTGDGLTVAPQERGENEPQSALSRIPIDEKRGEPMYESVDAETAWDAIVEQTEGDEAMAQSVVAGMVADKESALKKLEKAKSKGGVTIAEKIASEKERKAAIEAARKEVESWKRIADTYNRRIAEAEERHREQEAERRAAEQAEAARLKEIEEAEKAERDAIKKYDKELAEVYDEVKDSELALERLKRLVPETIDEAAAYVLSSHKLLWGSDNVRKGASSETGFGEGERRKLFGLFASREKGGKTIGYLSEDVMREVCDDYGIPYDNMSARDALIELVRTSRVPSDITHYISRKRAHEAREIKAQEEAHYQAQEEEYYQERYHMSKEEYDAYEVALLADIENRAKNFDENEFYGNIADEKIEREKIGYGNRNQGSDRVDDGVVRRDESEGTGTRDVGGAEVLSPSQIGKWGRGEANAGGPRISGEIGTEMPVAPTTISTSTPGSGGERQGRAGESERLADDGRNVEDKGYLTEDEADDLILASAERAIPMPMFELTSENWKKEFGDGTLETPIEQIKIGVNQFSKMIDKGREKEAGLIKPTFTDPDFVIEEASIATYGTTERASSHLYVKSFIGKDGKKRYFFKSVTVKRDGLEVNVSSHFDRPKRLREALKNGKLLYRFDGGAQTEQIPASVSVTTSRTNPGVSDSKDIEKSHNSNELGEKSDVSSVQGDIEGFEGYSREEVKEMVLEAVSEKLSDVDVEILGLELHGSRSRGGSGAESDLDAVVEYSGDFKEDAVFNLLHDDAIEINGVVVDVNPIRKEESGSLADYMERSRSYDAKVRAAEAEVNTNPTEAQKEAGNYKKGHVQIRFARTASARQNTSELGDLPSLTRGFGTFNVTIEQPKGSVRRGVDANGKEWATTMQNTYGYIRGTEGVDGDHIDVFLSDDIDGWNGRQVYVVDQRNDDGSFDEHKVMLGFNDISDAESAYMSNYEEGWQGLGTITGVAIEEFEKWIGSSHRKTKPFAEYKSVKSTEVAEKRTEDKTYNASDKGDGVVRVGNNAQRNDKKAKRADRRSRRLGDLSDNEFEAGITSGHELVRVEPKTKKGTIFDFVTKDKERRVLQGVHHDGGYAIATDSFVMVGRKDKYDATLEGKTINKKGEMLTYEADGEVKEIKYPNWRMVLPQTTEPTGIDIYDLSSVIEGIRVADGVKRVDELDSRIAIKTDDGKIISVAQGHLALFLRGAKQVEATEIRVGISQYNNAILYAEGDNGFAVVFGVKGVSERANSFYDAYTKDAVTTIGGREFNIANEAMESERGGEAFARATEATMEALRATGVEVVMATEEMVAEMIGDAQVEKQAVQAANERFNRELHQQIDGSLPQGHIYRFGMPSAVLQSAGLPYLPIELAASRLTDKSMQENHPFELSEVENLVESVQNPLAVFRSATHIGSYVVLTEIQHGGKNYVVAIETHRKQGKIEINSVRSVHYRNSNNHIANWIEEGLLEYADKKRMSEWLSKQRYNSADVRKLFRHSAKIVESFENPKVSAEFSRMSAPFYSNARKSVLEIKQEKGTPEQWVAMLKKNGGLKAGEEAWVGLEKWLNEQKGTVTKQEIVDYLNEKSIRIEEEEYGDPILTPSELVDFELGIKESLSKGRTIAEAIDWWDVMTGDNMSYFYETGKIKISESGDVAVEGGAQWRINRTRLEYTTQGLEGKREIVLTVPTIEPYNTSDEIHFGGAGSGRAVAWVRFGETEDSDGNRVLVIDEIQSKRHQDGREEGYKSVDAEKREEEAMKAAREATTAYRQYNVQLKEKYGDPMSVRGTAEERKAARREWNEQLPNEERAKLEELRQRNYEAMLEYEKISSSNRHKVPEAPFEKNWHELAMKRMLRYAAENGYDKVAWTTGTQQAERYDISRLVEEISVEDNYLEEFSDGTPVAARITISTTSGNIFTDIDAEGVVHGGEYSGKGLEDVVGKELANSIKKDIQESKRRKEAAIKAQASIREQMKETAEDSAEYEELLAKYAWQDRIAAQSMAKRRYSGGDLRIGGDGMKGFYDKMLPSFVSKYVKKWGAKVGEVTLPGVEESGRVMHAVDVTAEMRESVMQGQPMFLRSSDGKIYGWSLNGKIYLTAEGINPETPVHEYTHLWANALERSNPKEWKEIVEGLKGSSVWNEVMRDEHYHDIWQDESRVASEVLSRLSGRENYRREMARAEQEIKEATGAFEVAEKVSAWDSVKRALRRFVDYVKRLLTGKAKGKSEVLNGQDEPWIEFVERPLRDFWGGVNPKVNRSPIEKMGSRVDKRMADVSEHLKGKKKDGVEYTVVTEKNNRGAEVFDNFYTNKSGNARSLNTQLSAQADGNTASAGKDIDNISNEQADRINGDGVNNRKNINFASRYETKEGKTINYTSEHPENYGGLFAFDFSGETQGDRTDDNSTGANALQRQEDTGINKRNSRLDASSGEYSVVERVFTETGTFNFTSGEKIESADDVAYIFSSLEDAAKEHSFVVLVKDGIPTVVELGMGTFNGTLVDVPTMSLAYSRIRPDRVYFVHNHPSGNLKCSGPDVEMLKVITKMSEVPVEGVIINLKTGKYGTFDAKGNSNEGRKRVPEKEYPLTVHTLDKQIFAPDYDPMAQPLILTREDVAKLLNSQRMGARGKVSFLILTRANRVVGNIHTPYTKIPSNVDEMARYISERVIQFGGENLIVYGDFVMEAAEGRKLDKRLNEIGQVRMLDVVRVKGNHTTSAYEAGMLHEPEEKAEGLSEEAVMYRTSEEIEADYPNWLDGTTTESGKHSTQVEGTRKTYNKVGTWIEANMGKDVSILDASSGMGYGTRDLRERGFNIDDVEPYQSEERKLNNPATYSSYSDIDKRYDYIISNAVLNVIPDDWRSSVLQEMVGCLNPGGKLFINTRKAGEEKSIKDKIELDSPREVLVKRNGKIASYQRFFTPQELKEWVEGELGEGYSVEVANNGNSGTHGLAAVVVTKNNESPANSKTSELGLPISNHKGMENAPVANVDAKIAKNIERAKRLDEIVDSIKGSGKMGAHEFLHEVSNAMVLGGNMSTDNSRYAKLGGGVTLRISDHYGNVDSFAKRSNQHDNYGLVIKLSPSRFKSKDGVDYLEYVYFPDKLTRERQLEILEGLKSFMKSGRYELLPPPDKVHGSGKFKDDYSVAEGSVAIKEARVAELSEALNTPIRVISGEGEVAELPSRRRRSAKGWYDREHDEVVVVLPNNVDVADVENTVVHEVVGHKGLRELIGEERFGEFVDEVYEHATEGIRRVVDGRVQRMVDAEADRVRVAMAESRERGGEDANAYYYADMAEARVKAEEKRGQYRREATEEYMADMAGKIGEAGFEKMSREEQTLWGRIKAKVQKFLDAFLRGLKISKRIKLGDKDIAYILFKSWKHKRGGGVFAEAEEVVMREDTSWDEKNEPGLIVRGVSEESKRGELAEVNVRFNEELSKLTEENADKIKFDLGRPSDILLAAGIEDRPMKLYANKVIKKMKKHGFSLDELSNLPIAVADPIAVFNNLERRGNRAILTELQTAKGNFLVTVDLGKGGDDIDFNIISSVFGKGNDNIVDWIERGLSTYINKEKALNYLHHSALNAEALSSSRLNSATKIVESFENPTIVDDILGEEGVIYRDGDPEVHEREIARWRYEERVKSGWYQTKEALQDSMLGLKEAMLAIAQGKSGRKVYIEDIAGFENAYLGENRLSSVNQAEADAMARLVFKPMLEEISRLAKGKKRRAELKDYMMAKHGLERNAYMREQARANDEETERDFAGLTALTGIYDYEAAELEAQRMVDEYEMSHDTRELWKRVNAVTDAILSKSYECGLMSKETYEKVSGMYDYYIPLRGFEEKTSGDAYAYLMHKGSAFNAPIKKAEGRSSKADDPIVYLQSMAENVIMQGNRNKLVKQRFLNFVMNHPSDLASVSDLWIRYNSVKDEWEPVFPDNIDVDDTAEEVERKMALFEEKMSSLSELYPDEYKRGKEAVGIPYRVVDSREGRQHQIVVKRNGRDYVITINGNPRAAQAVNGLTNPDNNIGGVAGAIFQLGSWTNRQLSKVHTTRNPDFVASNFIRDMLYSNSMMWVRESPNYALRYHMNYARVNPVVMRVLLHKYNRGTLDMSDKTESMFYHFMMNGGETGYVNVRDIEKHRTDIERELRKHKRRIPIGTALSLLGKQIDNLNRSVENCARFAAFVTSREMGRSVDRSIYDAKEVSVNFNKKGSGDRFYKRTGQTRLGSRASALSEGGRALYMFWNAAIQGTTNFGRQVKRHPIKALMGMASMYLLGALVASLGADDDDEKNGYYNLPEYVRRSNIVFKAGDSWISIPLPIEYRALYGMGELMVSTLSGKERKSDVELAEAILGQVTQVLPLDFMEGGGGMNAFVPSGVKPIWEAYLVKKSWTGLPLYKDTPYNKQMPEWTKAYSSANKHIVGLTAALNEASGGDKYTKGSIDINPAKVEYMLNGYLGGYFNTANRLVKTAETIFGEREYDPQNVLLLNRLVKRGDERTEYRAVNNDYFKVKEEYEKTKQRLKGYEHDTGLGIFDYAEKMDFIYNSPEYTRYLIFEAYQEHIAPLTKELKDVVDEDSRKELESEINALKEEMLKEIEKTYGEEGESIAPAG